MKVGIFLDNILPESGGAHTFESEMLQSLVKFSAESNHIFIVFTKDKSQNRAISTPNLELVCVDPNLKERILSNLLQTILKTLRRLRSPRSKYSLEIRLEKSIFGSIWDHEIDIVWCLNPWSCPTTEIPYITTVWDLEHRIQPYFPEMSEQGQWYARERLYERVLPRASVIITGSEAGKAEIKHFYRVAPERIKVLPLPTPRFALYAPPDDGEQVLARYNIPKNYLFYPAQFWAHKNHAGLLQAVRLLRDQHGLIFPVVFSGSDKGNQHYIKQLVSDLNLSAQVYFLGFVAQEDLISLYRNAFALTFLSFAGPDNLPPLEAFALGCPVVASRVSGAQEQLGDAALLIDSGNPEETAQAIKLLYDDSALRQTLIQRGLERASKRSGEHYVRGMFAILDQFEAVRRCWDGRKPRGTREIAVSKSSLANPDSTSS